MSTLGSSGFRVRYKFGDDDWGESGGSEVRTDDRGMYIPLESRKGFKGRLRLAVERWNQ